MVEKPVIQITEDEAVQYDRQIRLWGLDAQKRLRAARVLVAGITGLGCEIAKNLVLCGVKSLTILDDQPLSKQDLQAHFLAPHTSIGENRAEASLQRLQRLNPMVAVMCDKEALSAKPESFFADNFDAVVVTRCCDKKLLFQVNEFCRKAGIQFFAGDIFGHFGYSFIDLKEHEFVQEQLLKESVTEDLDNGGSHEPPEAKKVKLSSPSDDEVKLEKHTLTFASLEAALNHQFHWGPDRRSRRVDPSFFILQMLLEFQSREGRWPSLDRRESDLELLSSLRDSIVEKYGLPNDKICPSVLSLLFSEMSPVAAIVGGVLSQEVIKAISHKDEPHNNFFFYNPIDSCGVVETLGY